MKLTVADRDVYAYTGGKPFDPALPTAVFIHGGQLDHSVWALQSRYFAHHGFGVLALDLPGHNRSAGPALSRIDELAEWLGALCTAAGVQRASLVGHSMGALIALQAAASHPERVERIALLGAAYPMTVSAALLKASAERPGDAIAMINQWSHSTLAAKPSSPGPGSWLQGGNQRLMERVGRGDRATFHTDFSACNAYDQGLAAAAAVRCPVRLILGRRDAMTPPRATRELVAALEAAGTPVDTVLLDAGHALMAEQPDAVLDALLAFVRK